MDALPRFKQPRNTRKSLQKLVNCKEIRPNGAQMNDRGQYSQHTYEQLSALVGASPGAPRLDYSDAGLALGVGTLLGILIGSRLTFHSPVRRRR
jgi:hypothetical protein